MPLRVPATDRRGRPESPDLVRICAPDGRIFIAEKSGVVRVFKNGTRPPTPLIDISAKVNNYWDRGLIGMALNPNFASNGCVYLLPRRSDGNKDDTGGKTARLSRYTVVRDAASPATESLEPSLGPTPGLGLYTIPGGVRLATPARPRRMGVASATSGSAATVPMLLFERRHVR